MKRLLYAFILLFGMFSAHGQSVWIGAENSDWTNPANWSAGVPTAGSVATIPANANAPVFGGTPIINYTIQLAGMLTFNDFVYNAGNIIIFESGSVVNNAQFVNAGGRVLDVDGHFENNGTLDNFGKVDVAASGSLDNEAGGIFNNNNETLAFGPVLNAGTTNNNGDFNIIASLDNSGNFNNYGTFESQAGSITENRAGATTENFAGGSYSVNGEYNNLGSTFNAGDFIVQIASIFTNENNLTNRTGGNMEVAGRIVNNSTLRINGPLMINSIGIIENNAQIINNGGIDIEICGNLIQQNTNEITGSIQNNGSVYEINGTINETNLEFGETFTDINGRPAPVPACKKDAFLQLPESGAITFTGADIERGRSYGSCGAQLVSITASPNSFTAADIGVQIVTITVTDEFGNSASCDDFVTVLPYTPPIVPVDDPDISFDCPEDVTVTPQPGAQFAEASFVIPEATTTCNPAVPTTVTLCPDVSNSISGFTYVGRRGGSKYFISHVAEDWNTANSIAQANGGQLLTIDDAAENNYIISKIHPASGSIWTGLRNNNNGNNFAWESGAEVNYLNWLSGEPNETSSNVAVRLVKKHGRWTDRQLDNHFEFVIEISCYDVHIDGYDYLGASEGNLYYESHATANWTNATNAATALGGNLATINTAAENTFIKNAISPSTGSVWIGLNNNNNGNNFSWQSGEAVTYTNWLSGEPNETQSNVAARLVKSHGQWTDRVVSSNLFEFVVELPSPGNTGNDDPELMVTQIAGPQSGGNFPVGDTPIVIEITDACGNLEICEFNVTVEENPAVLEVTDCPTDITINTLPGATTAVATFNAPGGNSTCFRGGPVSVAQNLGLESGEAFPIGNTQITYAVFDSCGNFEGCNFNVNVVAIAAELSINCPDDVILQATSNTSTANWTEPTASTNCFTNGLTIDQVAGPANGSDLAVGTYSVIYIFTDACNNTEICTFDVVVNNCPDADGDGVCAADDCDDGDASLPAASGTACNDGNPDTENDVIGADGCSCAGTATAACANEGGDADGDGICADVDCDDNDASLPAAPGTACNDGNPDTENDVIGADGCSCAGTVIVPCSSEGGDADGDGICADVDCDDNDASLPAAPGTACNDGNPDTENDVIGADGCSCAGMVIVPCSSEGGDADGDGICADVDCDDNDASLPAAPGTACNDGNPDTENDVIDADGCSCAGTVIVPCSSEGGDVDGDGICADVDCDDNDASLPAAPGTACNDGNPDTENDVIGADGCSCAGTPINTGCNPTFVLSPGNVTVNGLNGAVNSVKILDISNGWVDVVNCFGNCPTPASFDLPAGPYYITIGVRDANYNLICELIERIEIPGTTCNVGATCDDGDACTDGDVFDADCNCSGTPVADNDGDGFCAVEDCDDYDASVPTTPGTTCNDGNPDTENDVIGADGCSCAGTPIVVGCAANGGDTDGDGICADVDCDDNDASLPAAPGTACDDGDSGTENDVIGADGCSCAGTPINTGCNPTLVLSPGNITVNGLNGAVNSVKLLDIYNGWQDVVNCFGNCPTPASFDLPAGPYYLQVSVRDANYNVICELTEIIEILDGCTTGATCNDGDVCTTGDVFDADCNCVGTPVADNDGDGFCAVEDCDDTDASLPATPGSSCDDGNPATDNDVIGADGCTCTGVIVGACNPTVTAADNSLVIDGLSGPNNVIQIFNTANWSTVINCWGDCQNQVVDVDPGNYFIRLRVLDGSYQEVCNLETNVTVTEGATFSIAPETEFLRLFAREENRAVGLNWVNNSEYRNDYFVIERSLDGTNFTELKTVDAFGYQSQEVTNYEDEDIRPALGEGYYRVRQVFEDETMRYSNVEKVRFDIDLTEVGLFPNPAETEVQLSLIDFAGRSAEVQIYSPLGVLMDGVSLEEIPERAIRFNVASYQAGLYTITVKVDQRKRFSKRFVKIGM